MSDRDGEFSHASLELRRRPGPPNGPAGCVDGRAPSRLHRAAPARQFRRARQLPHIHCAARSAGRARGRRLRLAGGADFNRHVFVANRPLRKRAHSLVIVAHGSRRHAGAVHRRHRFVRRDLAGGGAAGSRAVGVAPRDRAGVAVHADRGRDVARAWVYRLAASVLGAGSNAYPRRARHYPGGTLCDRPCVRAPSSSRAPASGCCTPRKTATGCSPAT